MTEVELERLNNIIDDLWQLHQDTNDVSAQKMIKLARSELLILWNTNGLQAAQERDKCHRLSSKI